MNGQVGAVLRGLGGGLVATAAMSAVMFAAKQAGLMGKLPPERITEGALRFLRIRRSERQENFLSSLAHVGYGTGAGALFAAVEDELPRWPAPVAGVAFGLGVWALSYFGWVPALGIMPPPHRDRPGRPIAMAAAHVVYGAVLGGVVRAAGPEVGEPLRAESL